MKYENDIEDLNTEQKINKFKACSFINEYDFLLCSILTDLMRQNRELKGRLEYLTSRAVLHPDD